MSIAEIGINHNGAPETLHSLIRASADAGADAVKFQYRNPRRAYFGSPRELGDEIVSYAIKATYLDPVALCEAGDLANQLGLLAGISFFTVEDVPDILSIRPHWDFFKVPSVELTNSELLKELLSHGRPVYLSTGAHSETEVSKVLGALPSSADWVPFHCVSNYPTHMRNSRIGYLEWLKSKWQRPVGYSSHDIDWQMCIVAAMSGANYIERHITLDKNQEGLDHSSSSTPEEFRSLTRILSGLPDALLGNHGRSANQGELVNRQNLGRSYFINRELRRGEVLLREDLVYASPRIAHDVEVEDFIGRAVARDCPVGSPLDRSVLFADDPVADEVIGFCNELRIGIPIRPHDQSELLRVLPLTTIEYHMSFGDIEQCEEVAPPQGVRHASVHLPDYVSPNKLMDPFSSDSDVRLESRRVIEVTTRLASRIQEVLGETVPVVGSFPSLDSQRPRYLDPLKGLIEEVAAAQGVQLLPQWLPPYAWYFGGSVQVHALCDPGELNDLSDSGIDICLDTAHLSMSCSYFGVDLNETLARAIPLARHIHLGDATGVDGEGVALGQGSVGSSKLLPSVLQLPLNKVIEVWQGHLSNGQGFRKEVENLYYKWGVL